MSGTEATYLSQLQEDTMRRAWGERTAEERRRIVTAAVIFGRQLDERLASAAPPGPQDAQRFLMSLMNAVVEEFVAREGMDRDGAASFLGNVTNRDHILEFNEVLEVYETGDSGKSLNELLREAVEDRREKAIWSGHFSSG